MITQTVYSKVYEYTDEWMDRQQVRSKPSCPSPPSSWGHKKSIHHVIYIKVKTLPYLWEKNVINDAPTNRRWHLLSNKVQHLIGLQIGNIM